MAGIYCVWSTREINCEATTTTFDKHKLCNEEHMAVNFGVISPGAQGIAANCICSLIHSNAHLLLIVAYISLMCGLNHWLLIRTILSIANDS